MASQHDLLAEAWQRFSGGGYPEPVAAGDGELLGWIGPLARWAQAELRQRLEATRTTARLGQAPGVLPLPTDRLLRMIKPTLAAELRTARLAGELTGDSSVERFACFADRLADADYAWKLLERYPVLGGEIVAELQRWLITRTEFASRLAADLPLLREQLAVTAASVADVTAVDFGAGDAHYGGRSVAMVSFRTGPGVVYKPRSLSCDVHFADLISWLNRTGLSRPLRATEVIDRHDYGWVVRYQAADCPDETAVQSFYRRQGAFLAVFHLLRGYDLHFENVVAVGEHPVYFDLEALFYTQPADPVWAEEADDPIARLIRESVLAVGLLPYRSVTGEVDDLQAMDVSGLTGGAEPGARWFQPEISYVGNGTDQLELVRLRQLLPETGNRPVHEGGHPDPRRWKNDLIDGFTECYRLLLAHRGDLLQPDGPLAAFAQDRVRPVLRDTSDYRALLNESWDPDLLAGPDKRAEHLAGLLPATDITPIHLSEQRQLTAGDIPVFSAVPGETALSDDVGVLDGVFFSVSGMEAAEQRLASFSEGDLQQQVWFIEAAVASLTEGGHTEHARTSMTPLPAFVNPGSDPELNVAAAIRIGDRICASVVADEESGAFEWPCLKLLGGRYWITGSSGLDLYTGVSGIALFLAELGEVTGKARYRALAKDVVQALADPSDMPEAEELADLGIGAFAELGGVVRLLTRLGDLWLSPQLLSTAGLLVPAFDVALKSAQPPGVTNGVAGAVLSLITLYRAQPTTALRKTIDDMGRHLLNEGMPADAGFSSGAAGVRYALAAVAALGGATQAAKWRSSAPDSPAPQENSWCRGTAGLVLADSGVCALTPDGLSLSSSVLSAVEGALARGIDNDSLCHGTLGLVEALQAAGHLLEREDLIRAAHAEAGNVARRVLAGQVRTGVPGGIWSPGLMDGAAGIGHGLLRAATAHTVPSVLLPAAPGAWPYTGGS
ncbi:type 2 lanthipeptide synthetase LanM [Streptomyces sp. NBC_00996]|uniref:type 2 lanthipeptide synthetase LanM n=1 Tax=Streptomyces sp. NBC_00996 TaxID=2903710 RepID=UPI00386A7A27|nr:type 2 lanthipeptide synthetase LanM [Streptomyces sp. NBC_00996]